MKCPQCDAWSLVVDSRLPNRRRECGNGHRFNTVEVPATQSDFPSQQRRLAKARSVLREKGYLR